MTWRQTADINRASSDVPSLGSQLADEESMRPVGDFPF